MNILLAITLTATIVGFLVSKITRTNTRFECAEKLLSKSEKLLEEGRADAALAVFACIEAGYSPWQKYLYVGDKLLTAYFKKSYKFTRKRNSLKKT
jgi:hypothetical protein